MLSAEVKPHLQYGLYCDTIAGPTRTASHWEVLQPRPLLLVPFRAVGDRLHVAA
jgi:hypothetical protein